MKSENLKSVLAIAIVILLLILLGVAMYPFIEGFFGALIMFVLFNPLYSFFIRKGVNKKVSAVLVIIISIVLILIPLSMLLAIITRQIIVLAGNPELIQGSLDFVNSLIGRAVPGAGLSSIIDANVASIAGSINRFVFQAVSGAGILMINVIIMYFTLYYLLTQKEKAKKAKEIIPFNRKNSEILIQKFSDMTYSTVIVSGVIALIQGSLVAISFLIFGVKAWLLWGFIAAILSFIPVLGPPIVWVPASIYMLVQGNYVSGIGIFIFGMFLSNIDNFIRPYLQERVGKIHPLITLIGIFIGIPLFGILGIIIGPLIIAYVLLTLRMFKEEYLK
jgi:predicted PurR-regulated permease PerM